MSSQPLPNKRDVMLTLLAEASVFIHLDPRGPGVRVPPWFKNQPQLVLQVGLNMAVPIPDLNVGDEGITCTLSFSRRPFFCSIPWKSVFGLVREGGPGLVWPDDVPVEVAAQIQSQGPKTAGQKTRSEPGRGRLRAVGSEPSEAPSAPLAEAPVTTEAEAPAAAGVESPVASVAPLKPALAPQAVPAVVQAEADQALSEEATDTVKPLRSVPGSKGGSKREIPPWLRVVK